GEDDDARERRRRSLAAADEGRKRLFDMADVFVRLATLPDTNPVEFDLARITGDVVALSRPFAAQRRVGVAVPTGDAALPAHGRRDVVSQVLLDLLLDLLERSPNGATIDVVVERGAGTVRTALRASSPGTTPDADTIARADAAMGWAGGALRLE